jgi:hypothetical protein
LTGPPERREGPLHFSFAFLHSTAS